MTNRERDDAPIHPNEPPLGEDEPTPDLLPEGAARGSQTLPMPPNDTGRMTAPVSGWGQTVEGEEVDPRTEADEP